MDINLYWKKFMLDTEFIHSISWSFFINIDSFGFSCDTEQWYKSIN